ncbi:hypothetical protein OPQ81_010352 [Rhizoctonia solani]|nr:hypothetical protein OPQ81_010352 [Rhizoctonia solani]
MPLQAQSNNIYCNSNLVKTWGAPGYLSLPPVSPAAFRSLSDPNTVGSVASADFVSLSTSTHNLFTVASGQTSQGLAWLDLEEEEDNDPEGVRGFLCIAPILDRNAKANSLPFVLHCYSQWAITTVFEPLKIVHTLREQVISQFSSEDTRTRTVLIANVMNMFAKNCAIDGPRKSILNHLALDLQKSGSSFMASPPSLPLELDRKNAIQRLDSMLEILGLQMDTQPLRDSTRSLTYTASIFRRACSEPPGKPINLPNILLGPSINLRYFATIDIFMSVITGQSTHFQYEVPFSLELCEQMYQWQLRGNYGLQWLYGFPDQFIMLFAWINTLSETPGAGNDAGLISWIENQLPQIKVAIDESGDPSLRIGRMVLCKVDARDSRVVSAQKGFMRLVRGVKAGRMPDVHLVTSMLVAGVATIEERDRETLRQRILNVRECADRGTGGNDIMMNLEDIWARTMDEGRAAVWLDLRIAYSRLTGSLATYV